MAAGIGSRFGTGIKQLEPVDDANHIIMDYSIHDAIEAGFNHVVFIIRKDIEKEFKESVFFRKLFLLAFVTSMILFRTLLNRNGMIAVNCIGKRQQIVVRIGEYDMRIAVLQQTAVCSGKQVAFQSIPIQPHIC